jgi:hypothetical protein
MFAGAAGIDDSKDYCPLQQCETSGFEECDPDETTDADREIESL